MSAKKAVQMSGVIAGETTIATVGKEGKGLTYRGYTIEDLAEHSTFEEVAYLLLEGRLPTAGELAAFNADLKSKRGLPAGLKTILENLPAAANPMEVLRTGCSALGCLEPETSFDEQLPATMRLLASLPSMLAYWYHYSREGRRIEVETNDDSIATHFLHLLQGTPPGATMARAMDVSLILYAEHEFNASTFASRIESGQPDGIWANAPFYFGGDARRGGSHDSLPAFRISGHERGGGKSLCRHSGAGNAKRCPQPDADPAGTL